MSEVMGRSGHGARISEPVPWHDRYRQDPAAHHVHTFEMQVDGRRVVYGQAGSGPPVLFLHGWGLHPDTYRRALARLAAGGVRVLAPALPGFGGSDPLPGGPRSLEQLAEWVGAFVEAAEVDEPVGLAGHSMGGGVATVLAHRRPDLVRCLVLVNAVGAPTWSATVGRTRLLAERPWWDWGLHLTADLRSVRSSTVAARAILAAVLANATRRPASFWLAADVARRADCSAELAELGRRRLPVAVVWSSSDGVVPRAAFEETCALLGRPATVEVPGGHSWLVADPDAFAQVTVPVLVPSASSCRQQWRRPASHRAPRVQAHGTPPASRPV